MNYVFGLIFQRPKRYDKGSLKLHYLLYPFKSSKCSTYTQVKSTLLFSSTVDSLRSTAAMLVDNLDGDK